MAVAAHLGVNDVESPLMVAAREAWRRWCAADPEMAVADDLLDVPAWTLRASAEEKNAVLARLAALTATDPAAVTALTFLLVPGATTLANDLSDLASDVDGLVASQLWLEARHAHELNGRGVAAAILRRTRREVSAELGAGELARRRDRIWAESVRVARFHESIAIAPDEEDDPFWVVTELLMDAMTDRAIETFDAWLIGELARVAYHSDVPARRGRLGLTTPAVVEYVSRMVGLSPRAMRTRATKAIDRVAEYLAARDDPELFKVWRAQHPAAGLTIKEQMDLVISDTGDAYWVRDRDRAPDAAAREAGRDLSSGSA